MLDATRDYLANEDVLGLWIGECCVTGEQFEERSALLYESYRRWKVARGEHCSGQKKLSSTLSERGFRLTRDAEARKIAGLQLTDSERDAAINAFRDRRALRVS